MVNNSDCNNDTIIEWVAVNLEYQLFFVSIGNKYSLRPIVIANHMWFIIITKYITSELDNIITITNISSVKNNALGFNSKVRMISIIKIDIISTMNIGISSNSNNNMSFNKEVNINDNLKDIIVCLDVLLVIKIGLTSSQLNIIAFITLITCCGYPIPIFSIIQVGQTIKPLILLFWA